MTKLQSAILDAVQKPGTHLTAEQIYLLIKKRFPKAALGTIYRNLNFFADTKLIRRVARADAPDCYEGNIQPHDHAICARCGNMTDLNIAGIKDYLKQQMDCAIVSFDLTVNCICRDCLQANKGLHQDE